MTPTVESIPTSIPSLPNGSTPFAYIPPAVAKSSELAQYMIVGSFAVLLWDLVISVRDDYLLATTRRFTFTAFIFYVMRLSLACMWFSAIMLNLNTTQCLHWHWLGATTGSINIFCTHYMFWIRIFVLYPRNYLVQSFFALLGAGTVVLSVYLTYAIQPTLVGGACYLFPAASFTPYLLTSLVCKLLFDSLVSIAATYKLAGSRVSRIPGSSRLRRWWMPTKLNLNLLSDRFLRDTQWYFVLTACIKIPQFIIFGILLSIKNPTYMGVYCIVLAAPDFVLHNIIVSKLYRNLRLGKPGFFSLQHCETTMGVATPICFAPSDPKDSRIRTSMDLKRPSIGTNNHVYPPS